MKEYIYASGAMFLLSVIVAMVNIMKPHPRTQTYQAYSETISLMIVTTFFFWAVYLLFLR